MRAECAHCHKVYDIPDERLPLGKKVKFPCPSCKEVVELDLRAKEAEPVTSSPPVSSKDSGKDSTVGAALKKKILRTVGDLPPMPQAVTKARKILANPSSNFKDLAIVLVTDQAIATRILKMANSAYYGLSNKVSSIQQASVVLGYKTLAEIVHMASSSKLMSKTLKGYGLEAGELWHHSLAVAFGARFIANKKNPELSDNAFAAGLIHDAGKLVLDEYILQRKEAFEAFMADGQESFLTAEKELLGFDHAEIAFEICQAWNVPEEMTIGIRYHHYPSGSEANSLSGILHVADGIAMMSGLGTGIDALSYEMDDGAREKLGLESQDLNKIMTQVVASVEKTREELEKD
jgi:HD-like signal output (HDOD) protein